MNHAWEKPFDAWDHPLAISARWEITTVISQASLPKSEAWSDHVSWIQVIDKAFGEEADKNAKDALTRVVVSRSDVDMEEIKAVYEKQYKAKLEDKIVKNTRGNYRDALLSLVGMWRIWALPMSVDVTQ